MALLATAAALGLSLLLREHLSRAVFIFCFGAVTVSAWYGGLGPGLLAAVFSVLAADHFLLAPARVFSPQEPADLIPLAIFVVIAALISSTTESLRASRRQTAARAMEAQRLAEQLQTQTVELERQVAESRALAEELEQASDHLERWRRDAEGARQRLAQVLDSITDIFVAYDREWRFEYLNPPARATFRALGKDPDLLIGKVLWEEFPNILGTKLHTETQRAVRESQPVEFEEFYPAWQRWFRVHAYPTPEGGVATFVQDVTEWRRRDDALRESETRYRALVEASTQIVWTADAKGMVDDMPAWRELTGQTPEQVRGQGWLDAIHPDDRPRIAEIGRHAFQTRTAYENEDRVRMADGSYRWFRTRGVPVLNPDGSIREWVGTLTDIDEEKRAEERKAFLDGAVQLMSASLEEERTLADLTRLCVPFLADYCSVDLLTEDGAVRRVEAAHVDPDKEAVLRDLWTRYPYLASDRVGVPEVLRTAPPALIPSITDDAIAAFARDAEHLRLLRILGPRSYICVPLVARGRTFGALSLVMSDSGRHYTPADLELAVELARRASVAVDNARLYAQAEAASRAKTEFLATMSHELRTPLNAIAGYTELLEIGVHGTITEEQREDIRRIQRNERRLLALVNDVLNFARIEGGHVEYQLADVPLGETLGELESLVGPQVAAKELTFENRCQRSALVVRADRDKLQQIMLNLLGNAIKFTEHGGRVLVDCASGERDVAIRVHDTGRGIPADKLEAIFEPFVQVDKGLTRSVEGTGLGLAISRDLARAMGGDLTVESVVGQGSVFTLTLPRAGVSTPQSPSSPTTLDSASRA